LLVRCDLLPAHPLNNAQASKLMVNSQVLSSVFINESCNMSGPKRWSEARRQSAEVANTTSSARPLQQPGWNVSRFLGQVDGVGLDDANLEASKRGALQA
jgi:hypothetical protein